MPLHPFAKKLQDHVIEGDEKTNDEYKNHNGDFTTYFRNKQVKLDTQAKHEYSIKSSIFSKCIIYITGNTTPSFAVLKRLIVENGGQICAFLGGKSYATHIIAASLTSRKKELYANMKVVKPAWVTESIKVGRKLDWTSYRTIAVVSNHAFSSIIPNKSLGTPEISSDEEVAENTSSHELLDADGPEGEAARIEWILTNRRRVNCMDLNFVQDYFAKSRLHFLSMKKIELRRLCRKFITNRSESPGETVNVRRTLLHVDFDSFFVAVALKKHPDLRNKPVCVSNGSDGSDIASCNYVARERGVKNGMWVGRAKTLCPELLCLPYDFEEYNKCSETLYEILLSLNPLYIVAISVDEAMVDISNLAKDTPPIAICTRLRNDIKKLTSIDASIGVGSNVLLAKIALRRAKPAGQHIILDPNEISDFSVRDLPGVGHHLYSQLNASQEVHNLRQLQSIQLADLQSIVGNAMGQKLYGYSRGMDTSDILSLDVPIKTIGLDIGWGVRVITEKEKLKFVASCTEELWNRLVKSGASTETLTIKVYSKSESATFVPPKYMGRGMCDISSRSKRVLPRMTLSELKNSVTSLVQSVICPPLLFRGIGLHLKVNDNLSTILKREDIQQTLVTDACQTPRSTKRLPMVSIPPRKRQKTGATLTQMVSAPHPGHKNSSSLVNQALSGEIDMDVLAELPSQIRKEVFLNEDDYNIPAVESHHHSSVPIYKFSKFLDLQSSNDIRRVVKEWVQTTEMPTAEDAQAFYEFICGAAKDDSAWTWVLDINDWLQMMVQTYSTHEDWLELCRLVDSQLQQVLQDRV